ncbi:hypothetical protein QBC40DRAFT_309534 [Triangularia verruculosa]|uniref:CENP-V/GFA domain-containing protein n=1 Tax=Triangularia verruculosa TaxID=2587418 RepID=A0AAN6XCJ9_9PEZI|nr:hypothetical protein QBC40DRAFT_309534 [Triangularia verruculosa]
MNASCQCGAIRFKTPLPKPLALYICHCVTCQRQTSSAFGVSAIFPRFSLPAQLLQRTGPATTTPESTPSTSPPETSPPETSSGRCDANADNGSSLLSVYTRATANGQTLYCYFCKRCGTRLVHATPNKNVVSVKGGCLEGLDWKSAIHIWTKSAMVPIPEGAESYPEDCSGPTDYGVCQEVLDQPGLLF